MEYEARRGWWKNTHGSAIMGLRDDSLSGPFFPFDRSELFAFHTAIDAGDIYQRL